MKLPTLDDFKFNVHNLEMDFVKKATLSDIERIKFSEVAQKLTKMGLFMVGLDVIDEKIIEINITSPCYFINEINKYFSINLEKRIVNYILDTTKKHFSTETTCNSLNSKVLAAKH